MSASRVALVTGGSRGIGAATALALTAAGHRVAVCARGGAERRRRRVMVKADVSDRSSIDGAFAAVEAELGGRASSSTTPAANARRAGS